MQAPARTGSSGPVWTAPKRSSSQASSRRDNDDDEGEGEAAAAAVENPVACACVYVRIFKRTCRGDGGATHSLTYLSL